jgi:NaMN:DMB phosphoribosyltransferase
VPISLDLFGTLVTVERHADPAAAVADELAGGTQLLAAAALARHADVERRLPLATTSYLAADRSAGVHDLAVDLDVDVTVTDPGFGSSDHPSMAPFADGEAKEGVGMGGALAVADRRGVGMAAVRESVRAVYDRLFDGPKGEASPVDGDHS